MNESELTQAGGVSNGLWSTFNSIKLFISRKFNGKRVKRLYEQSKLMSFNAHNSKSIDSKQTNSKENDVRKAQKPYIL